MSLFFFLFCCEIPERVVVKLKLKIYVYKNKAKPKLVLILEKLTWKAENPNSKISLSKIFLAKITSAEFL